MVDTEILWWELKREKELRRTAEKLLFQKEQELELLKKQLSGAVNISQNSKEQADEIYSIALFPMEAPEPMLRISCKGEIILQNPASYDLRSFIYESQEYAATEFWKYVAENIPENEKRWIIKIRSNERTYELTCRSFKEDGYINVYGSDVTEKNAAVNSLKQSEQRWQALSENIPGAVYEFTFQKDGTGYFSYLSKKVEEIFGISSEKFNSDIIHKEDKTLFAEKLQETFKTNVPFYHEARVIVPGGQIKWHSSSCTFQYENENGDKIFAGIILDITDRKMAADALREAEERWKFALEGAGDGVWEFDFLEKRAFYSVQYKKMIGYEDDEFSNDQNEWIDHIHPSDKEIVKDVTSDYLSGKITKHSFEYRYRCKDGNYIWILDRGTLTERTAEGMPKKVIGTHSDITKQKELESQLETTVNRFSNLLINLQEGVLVEDETRHIVLTNQKFCSMFNIPTSPDTLVDVDSRRWLKQYKQLFKDPDHFEQQIEEFISQKQSVSAVLFELIDGRTFELDFVPIFIDKQYKGHLWKYADISEKINTEKKLEAQRKFYEDILNKIPADIAVFNDKHEYLFVNPVAINDPAIREWLIGKTDADLCLIRNRPLKLAEDRAKLFESVVSTKTQKEWEEEMQNKKGDTEYHLRKMYPVLDENGKVKLVIGYGINITERKKFEEQIKLSEKRHRDLFNFSQALICTHDLSGKIITVNPSTCRLLGYSEEEMTGKMIYDFIPDKDKAEFGSKYVDGLRKNGKAEGVFSVISKSGVRNYLLYQNYKVEEPGIDPYIIGFSQNITERIKAEEALLKSEEKYRSIIENMDLGLVELDPDSTILFANPNLCKMSGYSIDELVGKKLYNVFSSGESRHFIKQKMYLREDGISEVYEFVTHNKKGEPRWWLVSGTPLLHHNGKFKGSLAICLDITQQKILEQELRKAKQQAEQSAHAKEVFLANMSHEIRTPMNAILGMGKQLQKTKMDSQQQFYLEAINNASANLLVIINDILDFSKIEAGKLSLENIDFRLSDVISKSVQIVMHKAEEKGLALAINSDPSIAPVLIGDPYRINQVLINLLTNSIKFTEKGSVTINCTVIKNSPDEQLLCIEVLDTGIGMSEEFQKQLFHKFMQEEDKNEKQYGGTGLGMSIVKELVELMHGDIKVKSKKHEGTSVILHIPFKKGAELNLNDKEKTTINADVLHAKRILLVEDNEMNRIVATIILNQYGAVVEEAVNGKDAVDKLYKNTYDLVLMDMRMPVMDGIEATKIIRNWITKETPVIALTANAVTGEQDKCIQAGMNDFLAKPFEEDQLIQVTAKWLNLTHHGNGSNKNEIMVEEQLFSIEKLKEISRGNRDFIAKMLNVFTRETQNSLDQLTQAYSNNDIKKINATAHRLKASVADMSVKSISEEIVQLEFFDDTKDDPAQLQQLLNKTNQVLTKVLEGIHNMLQENNY